VAPTALHLQLVHNKLAGSHIRVAGQNCNIDGKGAHTGEIAAEMLVDLGLKDVIIGHSERRAMGETDEICAKKAKRAIENGLRVIFCIGESLEERNAGKVKDVTCRQLGALKAVLTEEQWANIVIAYEPIWSIGTGVVATPAQAQEVHAQLRQWLKESVSEKVANETRIQYGGSVNAKNCGELSKCADIDGFLVGGASLKPEFADIVRTIGEVKKQ